MTFAFVTAIIGVVFASFLFIFDAFTFQWLTFLEKVEILLFAIAFLVVTIVVRRLNMQVAFISKQKADTVSDLSARCDALEKRIQELESSKK